jgi:transitional endoplasmic reticulum ATPase
MIEVVRYNIARLLGIVQIAGLLAGALFVYLVASGGDSSPYQNGQVTGGYAGLMLVFVLYYATVFLAMVVGDSNPWGRGRLWLVLVGAAAWFLWANLSQYKELLLIAGSMGAVAIVKQLTRVPEALRGRVPIAQGANAADSGEAEGWELLYPATKPSVTFSDVVGMNEVKARLLDAAREVVEAGKKGREARNGILLTGEPGNGKSFMAEALAGELHLRLVSVSFGDMASKWVNQTTQQAVQAFADARKQAPCVLFIDEIDSLIRDRSQVASSSEEGPKTTNALLTELVKIRDAGVVLVAASNQFDALDPAAKREGRFDFKIEITPPDAAARLAIMERTARDFARLEFEPAAFEQATKRWAGYSVARIRTVVDQAGRSAKAQGKRLVEFSDLQAAMRLIQGRKGSIPEDTPELSEIAMQADAKEALLGVSDRMKHIEVTESLGGSVPTGLLFAGPPGVGKTLTARALAKTTGWAFLEVSGNALINDPGRLDDLMKQAKDMRPVIVFLDEAEDVLTDRAMTSEHVGSLTNKLLTVIDGAGGQTPDILWVAATNHPDRLDRAALRAGRFTEKFAFAPPDVDVITEYVRNWIALSKARFAPEVAPAWCAELLEGQTIANVKGILQKAVDNAVARSFRSGSQKQVVVGTTDIRKAVEIIVA